MIQLNQAIVGTPNCSIFIKIPMAGEAGWENELSKAQKQQQILKIINMKDSFNVLDTQDVAFSTT